MDARLLGFRIRGNTFCAMNSLGKYLCTISGQRFISDKNTRMFFAGEKEGCHVGVIVSLKDQQRFPEIEHGEEITVHIHEAEEGRSPFDFNFFAIDPSSGSGLYQTYRGAYPIRRFGALLCRLYDDLARNKCIGDVNTLLARSSNHRLRDERLEFAVLYKRENFEEVVNSLRRVLTFEYDIVAQEDMSKSTSPISQYARLERRCLRFRADVKPESVLEGIRDLFGKTAPSGMFRVTGVNEDGDSLPVDLLMAPPNEFAVDSVDSLADVAVLKFSDITQSPYVDSMIKVLKENPAFFGPEEGV